MSHLSQCLDVHNGCTKSDSIVWSRELSAVTFRPLFFFVKQVLVVLHGPKLPVQGRPKYCRMKVGWVVEKSIEAETRRWNINTGSPGNGAWPICKIRRVCHNGRTVSNTIKWRRIVWHTPRSDYMGRCVTANHTRQRESLSPPQLYMN